MNKYLIKTDDGSGNFYLIKLEDEEKFDRQISSRVSGSTVHSFTFQDCKIDLEQLVVNQYEMRD